MYKGCLRPALENGDEDPRLTDQVSETRVFQALNWEKRGPSIALDQYRNAPEWPPKWMCPVGARWTENTLTEALPVSPNAPRLGAGEFHPSSFVEKNSKTKRLSYSGKLESFSIFWEARWYEADCEKYNPSKKDSTQVFRLLPHVPPILLLVKWEASSLSFWGAVLVFSKVGGRRPLVCASTLNARLQRLEMTLWSNGVQTNIHGVEHQVFLVCFEFWLYQWLVTAGRLQGLMR